MTASLARLALAAFFGAAALAACETAPTQTTDVSGGARFAMSSRLAGSWIAPPGAGTREIVTFNPDGTRIVADGAGKNVVGAWSMQDGRLMVDGRRFPFRFEGDALVLGNDRYDRYVFEGERYDARTFDPGVDAYGSWAPRSEDPNDPSSMRIGDYVLEQVFIGLPDEFRMYADKKTSLKPILISFWNATEDIKMGDHGGAYRDDTVTFDAVAWSVTPLSVKVRARNAAWGEFVLDGKFTSPVGQNRNSALGQADGGRFGMVADVFVKGYIFRNVRLSVYGMH